MDNFIPMYFILKTHYGSCHEGSLHRSLDKMKRRPQGGVLKTLNLDTRSVQEIMFNLLGHLPGEKTYQVLLSLPIPARLNFLRRPDYVKLITLDVGHVVYFEGEAATIRSIGPVKTSSNGWFYLIEFLNKKTSIYTSIDTLSIYPPMANNNGVNNLIQHFEIQNYTSLDNKNYANGYFTHKNTGRLSGSRALATPSPSQSYMNFSNSIKHHPLGLTMDTLKSRSILPDPESFQGSRQHQNNEYLSKSEIDGQISYISGRVNGRSHESSLFQLPVQEDQYQSYRSKEQSSPMPGMQQQDLTYSTVIKEDNQKRSTRYIPHSRPGSEVTFTTALNILDEQEPAFRMRDTQTCGSSTLPRAPFNHNNNSNKNFERGTVSSEELSLIPSVEKVRHPESGPRESASLNSIKTLNCEFDTVSPKPNSRRWEIGSLVVVHVQAKPLYGVIKWIGRIPPSNLEYVGVELEERLDGAGNGVLDGQKIFECPEGHGVFVTLSKILKDKRFDDSKEDLNDELANMNIYENDTMSRALSSSDGDFGFTECPSVPGHIPPMDSKDLGSIIGRNKGIQGYHNSCYLDSTIFAMFSFTSVFDFLLYRPPNHKDIKEYSELQKVLREDIVNPLRKNFFVRADKVMKLRKFLGSLSNVQGLTSEEKDPEELLNCLLCQTLKAQPFLYLSSGQTSHYYQLFVERDEFRKNSPTVQELFEQSFFTSDVKLKSVPSVLILQMPRFGRQFKVYDQIRPTQILDITDIIEGAPRQCIVCGNLAYLECHSCFGVHSPGLDSTAFCRTCHERTHCHKNRQHHSVKELILSPELIQNKNCTSSRLYMKLFAVLCIETSHYVTFTKCGDGPKAPWCLFDSMADRKGEANGYNIPEVSRAHDLENYFRQPEDSEDHSSKALTPCVKRLLCDGYMYFYQSKEVMMYQ